MNILREALATAGATYDGHVTHGSLAEQIKVLQLSVKSLSKELEEFMEAHCECPSKGFNRAGCIEQIILNHIEDHTPQPPKTVISFIREENS